MYEVILGILRNFRLADAVDIAIVSFVVYKVLNFIKETRAQKLVRGIAILLLVFFLSDLFDLYLLNWLLKGFATMGLFALVVLFQPEIRRGLEQMGRRGLVSQQFKSVDKEHAMEFVSAMVTAIDDFSATRTGALIAIERDTMLNDIIETGAVVDAKMSVRLIENLFYEGSPLHDGAVIIRGDRIHAASCVLPLTENKNLGRNLGTRHRAGVGLSEVSDALVIIVSEESGVISVAENGKLRRFMDLKSIEKMLLNIYLPPEVSFQSKVRSIARRGGRADER